MNVHKGGEGHCKVKSAPPPSSSSTSPKRSPKILLLELGFATIRVCGRYSDGSGRGVLWSRDSRSRGTARDMCESSARLRVSCRVGWRLSVVCRGWSGAELRPERSGVSLYSQKYLRTPAAAHPLSQNYHPHRAPAISQLHHTAPRGAAPLSDNTNQYYAPFLRTLFYERAASMSCRSFLSDSFSGSSSTARV